MNGLVPPSELTTAEILERSNQALAIISICAVVLDGLEDGNVRATTAGEIALALRTALVLIGPLHEAMERIEGAAT